MPAMWSVPEFPHHVPPLDGVTEARLLRAAHRDDIPGPYQRVADVIGALTAAPTATERAGEAAAVAAFVVSRRAARDARLAPGRQRRPVFARLSACAVLVVAGLGGLAATSGALPTPLQAAAHRLFAPIGIPAPHPSSPPANGPSSDDGVTPPDQTPAPTAENDIVDGTTSVDDVTDPVISHSGNTRLPKPSGTKLSSGENGKG